MKLPWQRCASCGQRWWRHGWLGFFYSVEQADALLRQGQNTDREQA